MKISTEITENENRKTMRKINEKESWFFKKTNKIDNFSLVKLTGEKIQVANIKNYIGRCQKDNKGILQPTLHT